MPALEDYSIFDLRNDEDDDHPLDQVIGDLQSAIQTRKVSKNLEEHSWLEAIQEELLQFKLQEIWTLVDLPKGKRVIGSKWVFRNKKDERGIVIKNKARFVSQGYTQEEGIDYDEVFAHVARIEAIQLFLAYASFKDFVVYQMDVKSTFLYGRLNKRCMYANHQDLKIQTFLIEYTRLNKHCMDYIKLIEPDVKTASTPMETQKPLLKDEISKEVDVHMY
ncbi:putative ribonuclease H-like domain-containing protein, partial [Tanacetum coccineum]